MLPIHATSVTWEQKVRLSGCMATLVGGHTHPVTTGPVKRAPVERTSAV